MKNGGEKPTAKKKPADSRNGVAASGRKSVRKKPKPRTTKALATTTKRLPATPNVETLILKAIAKGQLDTVERLLVMRRELKAESAKEQYVNALARFQKICPTIPKTKIVRNKESKGGGVRYRYAPLDVIIAHVHEPLAECGFSYMIKGEQDEKQFTAIVEGYHVAGHSEVSRFSVPIEKSDYMSSPQSVASAQTFAKRQAFCNLFGIVTTDTDDDGSGAGMMSENGAEAARDVTPKKGKRQEPQTLDLEKMPEDAQKQIDQVLDNKMPWLPEKTREFFHKQAADFIKKKDLKSLRGLAQSLSKQIAIQKQQGGKK